MKSFLCRINFDKLEINQHIFNSGLDRLVVKDNLHKELKYYDSIEFGAVDFNKGESIIDDSNSDFIAIADCRIDNKKELLNTLQIRDKISDEALLIEAYKKWGDTCPDYLLGDFAFIIWNKKSKEFFGARDHLGLKSFYYYYDTNVLICSSEINAILTQTDLEFNLDEQYVADSISIVKSEKDRTMYNEIKKLPPASTLKFKDSELRIDAYWELQNQKTLDLSDDEIIIQFKSLLLDAVKCRVKNLESVGAELSGGLDSSSITSLANQFTKVKTFSHVLPDEQLGKIHPYQDERKFQEILVDFCKIDQRNLVYSDSIGLLETLESNVSDFDYLNQQNFSTFSDDLYEKAEGKGVCVLLSGFGGDEVVTSKASGYLSELARLGLWGELKADLKNQKLRRIIKNKRFFTYWFKFKAPRFYKFLSKLRNQKPWWLSKFENLTLNEDYAKKMKIEERYFSNYSKLEFNLINERCIERITHPHVSQRLEYCSQAAKKYGIEYRYPLLDKRLIEFYLSMPSHLKAQHGIGRLAIRKAMEGLLPKEIQWRNDKTGATIPTVYMRLLMDKDKIAEIIKRAKSNKAIQKYIDLEKYEQWYTKQVVGEIENPGAFYNYLKLVLFIEKNPTRFK